MIRLEKFNGQKTYMYPNGEIATPQRIMADFPASAMFPHVLEVNGNVCQAVQELASMRNIYNVAQALTDDEAIIAIQTIVNTPVIQAPSAEERIAAAMEYQNLLSM